MFEKKQDGEAKAGRLAKLGQPLSRFLKRFRALVDRRPWLSLIYKITVAIVGGVVILAGIAMLVLPGPGWLTIFLGLALLGTEFHWARSVLTWLRLKVMQAADRWRTWRRARAERKKQEKDPA